jgi:hypothetical protein
MHDTIVRLKRLTLLLPPPLLLLLLLLLLPQRQAVHWIEQARPIHI